MLVSDLYADAREILGYCDQDKIFSRLTDAIETLANKGTWEPLLAYMDISVQNGYYITLPNSVEVPLRINIEDHPAFPRDRTYEFVMNGPATNSQRVEWSWEDMGDKATVNPEDGSVTRASGRVIRISKQAVAVRMLVRLSTTRITSTTQFIPLHSKAAVLLQLKALESYRRGRPEDFQLGQAQEAQAFKFLQEEQASRGAFLDLSKALDNPAVRGYTFNSNNVVVVSDIYDEANAICGGVGQQHLFDRITEALEVLANKGQWDGMTAYMDMVPESDVIGLPRQVEVPIRINIEKRPSLARGRLFEFSLNGPGTDLDEVSTLTWEDQGFSPLMLPLQVPSAINVSGSQIDAGKYLLFYGIDKDGKERSYTYFIPANDTPEAPQASPIIWKEITRITKQETVLPVYVYANYKQIAVLMSDDTEPSFRTIKLNKKADNIKIMYRKSSLRIKSVIDVIPLRSRSAIITMMKSLQILKKPDLQPADIQMAEALEAKALKFLQDEEQSRLAYVQASAKDIMPALGINTNTRNVVLAGDVYDDAADIFGAIGRQRLFDKITEAQEMLANKSQWDGLDGYVDILSDQRGYITFPRHVEVPIMMNYSRCPAQFRNKWYEFHMNGMGTDPVQGDFMDDAGEYPLVFEPTQPLYLFAVSGETFSGNDNQVAYKIRAYGYGNTGLWIRSNENGKMVDGELVPLNYLDPNDDIAQIQTTNNQFRMVTRVTKEATEMPIQVYGTATTMLSVPNFGPYSVDAPPPPPTIEPPNPQFLAFYESDETEPMFRRIRVPLWVTWARMRFRVSLKKITKMSDPLWMKSRTAIVTMMRALKALESGDINAYQGFDVMAVKLLAEEQNSRNPAETFDLQFDQRVCFADPLQGQY